MSCQSARVARSKGRRERARVAKEQKLPVRVSGQEDARKACVAVHLCHLATRIQPKTRGRVLSAGKGRVSSCEPLGVQDKFFCLL